MPLFIDYRKFINSFWAKANSFINSVVGTYTCAASTPSTGIATASGALLIDGIMPTIEGSKELHQAVPEGEDIRVPCKYDGDPKPTQVWYKVIFWSHLIKLANQYNDLGNDTI